MAQSAEGVEHIQKEKDISQKALLLGIPTAISYDVVKVGDRYGIVYELLNSRSYTKVLQEDQDKLEELGRELGNETIMEIFEVTGFVDILTIED